MGRLKQRTQRIELGFLGADWEHAYIEARRLHWRDLTVFDDVKNPTNQEAEAAIVRALQDAFVSGRAPGEDGQLIDLTKEDLRELDIEAQTAIYERIQGKPDPNG